MYYKPIGHAFGELHDSICPLEVGGATTLHREFL